MISFDSEPILSIGLMEDTQEVGFEISGEYWLNTSLLSPGRYKAHAAANAVILLDPQGREAARSANLHFIPKSDQTCFFSLPDMLIGKDFHWQQSRSQKFHGELFLQTFPPGNFMVINRVPLETYLEAVVCSEMSSESPQEFLKAHCAISRSWLLAQLEKNKSEPAAAGSDDPSSWTDSGIHKHFDVCADDHCQRYHGIGKVNIAAQKALRQTRGQVLVFGKEICDTRFSKCCGGITESFSTAWQDRDMPYLKPVPDCPEDKPGCIPPVSTAEDAHRFICSSPGAYCNVSDKEFLKRILPDFDFETDNFFRWKVKLSRKDLRQILLKKTGIDFGHIKEILPLARGASGRIYKLKIRGEKQEKVFGKELEIRRILSPSHLYSSAFVVEPCEDPTDIPEGFTLKGAGWGHGVGLCQIGAACMAQQGHDYKKILYHYFRGAKLKRIY
jgi:SpoIID/LytB domain protein